MNSAPSPTSLTAAGSLTPSSPESAAAPSVLHFVNLTLRRKKLFVRLPLALAVITVIVSLIIPRHYTTEASFTAVGLDASSLSSSQLSGLAAQFGVSLGSASGTQSPDFYSDLITSSSFLQKVAQTRYVVPDGSDTLRGDFAQIDDISESDSGKTVAEAIRILGAKIIAVDANSETGVVTVNVRTEWPMLSYEISRRVFALVDSFNLQSSQIQAAAQQRFMHQRVDTAQIELTAAEEAMKRFLEANRAYQSDPQLAFEFDRLQRDVTMRQAVYTTLMQSYEQARVEAARNTPSISPVEAPAIPLRYDRLHLALKALFAAVMGVMLAALWTIIAEFAAYVRTREPHEAETTQILLAGLRPRWLRWPRRAARA